MQMKIVNKEVLIFFFTLGFYFSKDIRNQITFFLPACFPFVLFMHTRKSFRMENYFQMPNHNLFPLRFLFSLKLYFLSSFTLN